MHRPPKLPELVESIYDAGLDPSLWNHVVAGVRDFVGGQACGLFSKDLSANSASPIIIAAPTRTTSNSIQRLIRSSIR